ncbi:MAG: Long-chain-fatty-acid--CoA ligase FadD15 [Candidatus Omnitrophica bacterium ADurb.Bin314]|nr:MAG: Long-chain-fatty-acid--CoA ligase FadD15 [Candidatus Omnitrophica bacterium ADurb.Bin314]
MAVSPAFPSDECFDVDSSIPSNFLRRASFFCDRTALRFKTAGCHDGKISWRQWMLSVRRTAMGLQALGVQKGDRIGILSENRPEWTFADLGALSLGAIVVPLYPTSSVDDIAFIVRNARLKALFVSTVDQLRRVQDPALGFGERSVIIFDPVPDGAALTIGELQRIGRDRELNNDRAFEKCLEQVSADDPATIIYTSGTTGAPKGVILTHRSFMATCSGARHYVPMGKRDVVVSFLPLSHVFERAAGYYFSALQGVCIVFAENMQTVADDVRLARPTVMFAVPRFFEKAQSRILGEVERSGTFVKMLFRFAMWVGGRVCRCEKEGVRTPARLRVLHALVKRVVLSKIPAAFGGRMRFFVSGGAPLAPELARFMYSAGLLILEGYGLTEVPVIAVNAPFARRCGSVGRPFPNLRVRIASDGEILVAGPGNMSGYYGNPEGANESVKDGWFLTGDIGHLDPEGYLHITDRKKDIIVTAGGKNVAPTRIEGRILADSLFSHGMVVGDKKPYLAALIVPHRENLVAMAEAAGVPVGEMSYADLLRHETVREIVRRRLESCLEGLAGYERIKAFDLLEKDFSAAAGELTPTLKIRRRVVAEHFRDRIDAMYRGADEAWSKRGDVPCQR